jgi:hypothetical protein
MSDALLQIGRFDGTLNHEQMAELPCARTIESASVSPPVR